MTAPLIRDKKASSILVERVERLISREHDPVRPASRSGAIWSRLSPEAATSTALVMPCIGSCSLKSSSPSWTMRMFAGRYRPKKLDIQREVVVLPTTPNAIHPRVRRSVQRTPLSGGFFTAMRRVGALIEIMLRPQA